MNEWQNIYFIALNYNNQLINKIHKFYFIEINLKSLISESNRFEILFHLLE
jgi:hypothetical protein